MREVRARFDLSQERVGLAAGLHRNYVGAIERGEINPTFKVLLKLPALGELLALVDALRIGDARVRGVAARLLSARLDQATA